MSNLRSGDNMCTEGATEEYSVDRTYIDSKDSKGHSKFTRFRIADHYRAPIAAVVAKVDAYRSEADFLRDAVVHRLRYHELVGNLLPEQTAAFWLIEHCEQHMAMLGVFASISEQIQKVAATCHQTRATAHLEQFLDQYQEQADLLPEPFRSQVNKTISHLRAVGS
jgi:hypothetical protein